MSSEDVEVNPADKRNPADKPGEAAWPMFFVDFNSYGCGLIANEAAWRAFVARAQQANDVPMSRNDGTALSFILAASKAPERDYHTRPSFGYRVEHTSEITLEAWGLSKGIDLRALAAP